MTDLKNCTSNKTFQPTFSEQIHKKPVIEIEITGHLTRKQLTQFRKEKANWDFRGHFDRYVVNFTNEEMKNKQLDFCVKLTNRMLELVMKRGELGSGKRTENIIQCEQGQFESLISIIVLLGFKEAIGYQRIIDKFVFGDVELSIIEAPNHSFFYEAELLRPSALEENAIEYLTKWAKNLGLQVFNKNEYLNFINDLDTNANDLLNFNSIASWRLIKNRVSQQLKS